MNHNKNGENMIQQKNNYKRFILTSLLLFLLISIVSIHSASIFLSKTLGNLVLKQMIWYIIGLFIIYFITKVDNSIIKKYSIIIYISNLLLLVGLFFFAPTINGSRCWYVLKYISFQPSEFMKLSLIIIEAKYISEFNNLKNPQIKDEIKLLISIFILLLLPSILTFIQPDTGAVITYIFITIFMLFISKIKTHYFTITLLLTLLIMIIFFLLYFNYKNTFIHIFGTSFFYRMDRITNFLTGNSMQLQNSLTAIGSSGIFGHGFNRTPIYFPEAGTDFIFTVFVSNFGLIIATLMIIYLIAFDLKLLEIATLKKNLYNTSIIVGIIGLLLYQQIQNIGMSLGILPIIGITLPFISYGGSSIISYMIMIGLIINSTSK